LGEILTVQCDKSFGPAVMECKTYVEKALIDNFFDTKIIYNSTQVEMKKIISQLIKNEIANENEITFLQQALTKPWKGSSK